MKKDKDKEKDKIKNKEEELKRVNELKEKRTNDLIINTANQFFTRGLGMALLSGLGFFIIALILNLQFFYTFIFENKDSILYGFDTFSFFCTVLLLNLDYSTYRKLVMNMNYYDSPYFRKSFMAKTINVTINDSPYKDEKDEKTRIRLEKEFFNDKIVENIDRELSIKTFYMLIGFLPLIFQLIFVFSFL